MDVIILFLERYMILLGERIACVPPSQRTQHTRTSKTKNADPNILLLDEPTNHLDLESVEWLEAFLRNQNIPMVIVSHDREFLDQVCTKIVDAEGGLCTEYQGNYSRFLQLKKGK